jgi:hypothetical protein
MWDIMIVYLSIASHGTILRLFDSDLDRSADHPPEEHDGVSEMSYSLLRYEILSAMSLVMNPRQARCDPLPDFIQTREQAITEICTHIQRKYIQHLDSNNSSPIFCLFAEAGRLVLAKIQLQAHCVFLQRMAPWPYDLVYPQAGLLLEELFQSSITLMENYTRLALDRGLEPWRWHIRQYMQWHALSFVMSQLRLQTDMLIKERANYHSQQLSCLSHFSALGVPSSWSSASNVIMTIVAMTVIVAK